MNLVVLVENEGFEVDHDDRWLRSFPEVPKNQQESDHLLREGDLTPPSERRSCYCLKTPKKRTADRIYQEQGVPANPPAGLAVVKGKPNRAHRREPGHAHCQDAPLPEKTP